MDSFIKHIIADIDQAELSALKDQAYVFPTRRACHYFREALVNAFRAHTFWTPKIFSIEDFVEDISGLTISDDIHLIFELYEVYTATYSPLPEKAQEKEELPTFDRFYAWGQVLLKDFDEVDRYLVDANKLYGNLQELKDLENLYADNEEVLFALKRFNEMMGQDPTQLMTNFTNQWKRVSKTYHAFKQHLQEKGLRYSGQLYREVAEKLQNGSLQLPYTQVVFGGFNALSTAEEVIFDSLTKHGKAMKYWDADRWYLDNDRDEAGKFLREYYRRWGPSDTSKWIITAMLQDEKQISLLGGVQSMGQAQVAGQLLQELPQSSQASCAVVLADESLLFPMLYALPPAIEKLNVTMGFPLKNSLWFRLAQAYLQFQMQLRGRGDKVYYEISSFKNLLANSLLQQAAAAAVSSLQRKVQYSRSKWVHGASVRSEELPATLLLALTPQERVGDLLANLRQLLVTIYHKMRLEDQEAPVEAEFAYHSIKQLQQLELRLERYRQQMEPKTLVRLVAEAFQQAKVPFSGEPIGGVQLMGFLETRALDFDHLIMLSVNEGKLPKGQQYGSYIPYAMRKAFNMPTFEEQDAIYSYHFKRSLQRAKQVSILYNTEVAIDGSGEKSRFLWQLQQAYQQQPLIERIYQMPIQQGGMDPDLAIPKTGEIMAQIQQRFIATDGDRKSLSATAIRHYLDCGLRFYFRYILRLPERAKVPNELDARDFGNIVHKALEKLYVPWVGQTISREDIKNIIASQAVMQAVKESFHEHYRRTIPTELEGKDVLHEQIVQKLLIEVLYHDMRSTPFKLQGTEQNIGYDLELPGSGSIRLEGTLDRVQEASGMVQIVDYKTGRADLLRIYGSQFPEKAEPYIQSHFEEPRFKSGFQGLFYGYLWQAVHKQPAVKMGVYPLKKVKDGIQWLNAGTPIPTVGFALFEKYLVAALTSLFDETKPFEQTQETDRCRFCAYQDICQR